MDNRRLRLPFGWLAENVKAGYRSAGNGVQPALVSDVSGPARPAARRARSAAE
jgi:hypothetical protein